MKKLFMSFAHTKGFGNCTKDVEDGYEVKDIDDVRELHDWIESKTDIKDVTIMSMTMLPIK